MNGSPGEMLIRAWMAQCNHSIYILQRPGTGPPPPQERYFAMHIEDTETLRLPPRLETVLRGGILGEAEISSELNKWQPEYMAWLNDRHVAQWQRRFGVTAI